MMDSRRMMLFGTLCTLLFAAGPAAAQDTTVYHISFPNRQHNEAHVTVEYRNLPPPPLEPRISRPSPGRYALHERANNVYNVTATNSARDTPATTPPSAQQRT